MTDLETARERLRVAEADAAEAQRVWDEARAAFNAAELADDAATTDLVEARERMRDARDAVVKLERK